MHHFRLAQNLIWFVDVERATLKISSLDVYVYGKADKHCGELGAAQLINYITRRAR